MKKLCVCHVTHIFSTRRYSHKGEWMYHFARRGHEVYVVSSKLPNQPCHEELDGIKIFRVPMDFSLKIRYPGYPVLRPRKVLLLISKLVREYGVEVIHFRGIEWPTSLAALFLDQIPKALTVVGIPGFNWFYGRMAIDAVAPFYSATIGKLIMDSVSKVVVRSKLIAVHLRRLGIPEGKIVVLVRGIDEEKFANLDVDTARRDVRKALGLSEDDLVVLYVGRLEPMKGVEYLIRAIRVVLRWSESVKLVVVGYGTLSRLMEKEAGRTPNIIFLGFRRDIPQLMAMADMLVLPSVSEAFPLVLVEAGFVGLPVIATNVGGVPDILDNGRAGIIVPPKNPRALANAILLLAEDPDLRDRLGRALKRHVTSTYRWDKVINEYERFFGELARNA